MSARVDDRPECARPSSPGARGARRRACRRRSPRRAPAPRSRPEPSPSPASSCWASGGAACTIAVSTRRSSRRLAPQRVTIDGVLQTDPSAATYGWSAVAQVHRVEWADGAASLRSLVWISGDEQIPRARRGDRVRLDGVLRVPDDPGFASILRHKGIPAQLGLDTFTRLGPSASVFVRTTQSVRGIVGRSIERAFPPKEAGLLLGLLLGDDSELDPALERDFRASGLSHLLVVSGGNVAMVLAPVFAATALLRLPRWPKFVVGFGAVAFFTVLTGAEPSVLRAGVMACLALVGVLMGRPRTTASILAGAVFALLVLDPWLAWSVGFQLSVTATAGMVALASALADRFGRFLPRAVATAAGATLSAQLGVTPVLLFYFSEVPLVTLPANLAAFPLVSPSLLFGAVAAGAGLLWAPLGSALATVALVPMRVLEFVADHLGKAPVGYLTADGGAVVLIGGTAVVVAITVWIRTGWRPPRVATVMSLACLPAFIWASALGSGPPTGLTIQVLDVGQGDAILVTSPAGASILVDGGPDERAVATQLAALGVKRLDMVVATHPHADHVAGLPTVLSRVPVGVLLQPGCSDDSPRPGGLGPRDPRRGRSRGASADRRRVPRRRPPARGAVARSMLDRDRVRREQRLDRDPAVAPRGHRAPDGRRRDPRAGVAARGGHAPRRGRPEGAAPRRRHVRSGAVRRRPRRGRRRERGRRQRLRASQRRDRWTRSLPPARGYGARTSTG